MTQSARYTNYLVPLRVKSSKIWGPHSSKGEILATCPLFVLDTLWNMISYIHTSNYNYLENQLRLISINFTPKTSHSCLKKWYTRFSRYIDSYNVVSNHSCPETQGIFIPTRPARSSPAFNPARYGVALHRLERWYRPLPRGEPVMWGLSWITRWWQLKYLLIFTTKMGKDSHFWLIFSKWVETTN